MGISYDSLYFYYFYYTPISKYLVHQKNTIILLQTSFIQAILAVIIVGVLIYLLNKFKKIYLYKKLLSKDKID